MVKSHDMLPTFQRIRYSKKRSTMGAPFSWESATPVLEESTRCLATFRLQIRMEVHRKFRQFFLFATFSNTYSSSSWNCRLSKTVSPSIVTPTSSYVHHRFRNRFSIPDDDGWRAWGGGGVGASPSALHLSAQRCLCIPSGEHFSGTIGKPSCGSCPLSEPSCDFFLVSNILSHFSITIYGDLRRCEINARHLKRYNSIIHQAIKSNL